MDKDFLNNDVPAERANAFGLELVSWGLLALGTASSLSCLADLDPAETTSLIVKGTVTSVLLLAGLITRHQANKLPQHPNGKCPSCGYDMQLTPKKCPECGLEWEVWQASRPKPVSPRRLNWILLALFLLAVSSFAGAILLPATFPMTRVILSFVFIAGGVGSAACAVLLPRQLLGETPDPSDNTR